MQYLNLSELSRRGWSRNFARKVLTPDTLEWVDWGYFRPLYSLTQVEIAESQPAFISRLQRKEESKIRKKERKIRKKQSKNATVSLRRAYLNGEIEMPLLTQDELAHLLGDSGDFERRAVNLIRHEFTHYDRLICDVSPETVKKIKRQVLCAIARTYPSLKDACDRQTPLSDQEVVAYYQSIADWMESCGLVS